MRREYEALGDGIESQLFELVRHIVVILLLVVRAGKTRAYLARGILYHFVGFIAVLFEFISHNFLFSLFYFAKRQSTDALCLKTVVIW